MPLLSFRGLSDEDPEEEGFEVEDDETDKSEDLEEEASEEL